MRNARLAARVSAARFSSFWAGGLSPRRLSQAPGRVALEGTGDEGGHLGADRLFRSQVGKHDWLGPAARFRLLTDVVGDGQVRLALGATT